MYNEELHTLYPLLNVIRVIKVKKDAMVRDVACTGERRNAYMVLVGKPEGKRHLEDLSMDDRILSEQILKK
jgi:hypothetical protein